MEESRAGPPVPTALPVRERPLPKPISDRSRSPFRHFYNRAMSHHGANLEFVHQSLHAWKAEPQPSRGGIAVLHGMCDVGDSRSLVAADHLDAAPCAIFQHLHHDLSAFRVKDDVAG